MIQGNTFGLDAYGGAAALAANDNGILVTNGSGGHLIGSSSGTVLSNTITNSKHAGVWIDATAGVGTLVRPNRIYGNGTSGTGLGIDLGALGPLANDNLDPDGSSNASQNAPLLYGSSASAVRGVLNSNVGATLRIDIYRSPGCAGGSRGGDAKARVGTVLATTGANGLAYFDATIGAPAGVQFLTATATNTATNSTSEIGACISDDVIFRNGAESAL